MLYSDVIVFQKMATLIDTDYPVYSIVALNESGTVLLTGGGGASHTGVPNALEVYRVELINRKPSACLLCRHDLGSELARQLSPCPHDPHVLVASVDDGCREVKVIFEGGEEVGDESGCEDDGERGGRVEVEEIGQKVEEGEAPIEKVTNTEGKEGTPTEKEESLTEKEESLRPKSEVDNEELHLAQEEKEEGGGAKDNGEDSTLRQRKKADKINTRRGHPEMAHPVNRDAQPSMREEQFAVELGEKHQSDFKEGEDALQKVAKFSFDGKLVVTGGVDGCVRVWKYPSFDKLHELQGHSDEIYDVDVHPKQLVAVSVSRDQEGIVWDLEEGKEVERFDCQSSKGTQYWTRCCQFSHSVGREEGGAVLHTLVIPVTWDKRRAPDSYLVKRDTENWLVRLTRSVGRGRATAMCVSNDGRLVAVGTAEGNVHIYSHKYQPVTMATNVHSFSVTGLAFCRLVDPTMKGTGSNDRGKMATLSVSADRTCCATMVTDRRGSSRTLYFFLIATVLLLLAIYVQFLLM